MGLVTALAVGGVAAVGKGVAGAVAAGKRKKEAGKQQEAALDLAAMTPKELRQYENTIKESERVLAREQKVIEAVNPSLMEAGRQALNMLQGKEAAALDPLRRQRERDRGKLEETLRRQLGPGYETSSAGIEALSRFDMDTSDILAQTQERATLQLLGVASQTRGQAQSQEQAALGLGQRAREATTQDYQRGRQRELNAFLGTSGQKVQAAGGAWDAIGDAFGTVGGIAGFAAGQQMGKVAAPSGSVDFDAFNDFGTAGGIGASASNYDYFGTA